MSGITPAENEFLDQLNSAVEANLSNNQFGVEELADNMHMSRSNLLRKVKKLTGMSVTQLISEKRLSKALDLLKNSSANVTEISEQVGFSSPSYFIKVFREKYGYSPGKTGEQQIEEENVEQENVEPQNVERQNVEQKKSRRGLVFVFVGIIVLAVVFSWLLKPKSEPTFKELSIAVLPFKNESSDSTNVYLINGLMESTLNNLQHIKDLKVISRTTSEKYRDTKKSIPEMAKELNVNYFIEGSGQKIGDKILLNIQLIEASTDRHLWSKQYRRETSDIFELQHEIASNIANEIEVVITPEADKRIKKKPTNNIVAYDYYLKGRELFYRSGPGDLVKATGYFAKAVEYDSTFALAYATAAMVNYYLDIFMSEKTHQKALDSCADRALRYDPMLSDSYIAKGLQYSTRMDFQEAVKYLEKAHELAPDDGLPIHFLTELYSIHVFDAAKYLEYALIGVKIDQASPVDSATTSFKYFHLSMAFSAAGFIDEASMYVDKALEYNPNNPFANYFVFFLKFAKDKDVKKAREGMEKIFKRDTMRIDVAQEVAKLYVMERDYKNAYRPYMTVLYLRRIYGVNVYDSETLRMSLVWDHLGDKKQAAQFLKDFKGYADRDRTIYRHMNLAVYHAYRGEMKEFVKEYRAFLDGDSNFHYWVMLLPLEPYVDKVKDTPEFKALYKEMEEDFWENNKEIKKLMESKKLL